jgi:rare lipoprotein A (peptidoglycan hydrolase)
MPWLRRTFVILLIIGLAGPCAAGDAGYASFYPGVGSGFTAAHRSLPFGTHVRVTRVGTGRSVVVRINDRGPFIAGRIIDISRGAAEQLQMISAGVARVTVEVIQSSRSKQNGPVAAGNGAGPKHFARHRVKHAILRQGRVTRGRSKQHRHHQAQAD